MSRVAILFPWGSLDTHPSLRNAAVLLAQAGHSVDLYVRRDPSFVPPSFEDDRIRVIVVGATGARVSGLRGLLRRGARLVEGVGLVGGASLRHLRHRYRVVIGVNPLGLVLAHQLARVLRIPLVYFSFELLLDQDLSSGRERRLKMRERRASREVEFALVQDTARAKLLTAATAIPRERCLLVPNAPFSGSAERAGSSRRWHDEFSLPRDEKVLLYAGSFAAWAGIEEIVGSADSWPDGWSLVVHLRNRPAEPELERLRRRGGERVFFSTQPVPVEELDDLYAAADAGVAFYVVQPNEAYAQENIRTIGLSSGKIAYYLRAGLPVIVNAETSLAELVRDEGCGLVVRDGSEIGGALARIGDDYDRYASAAQRAFAERLDFAGGFAEVIRRIGALGREEAPHV